MFREAFDKINVGTQECVIEVCKINVYDLGQKFIYFYRCPKKTLIALKVIHPYFQGRL